MSQNGIINRIRLVMLAAIVVVVGGCTSFEHSSTSPDSLAASFAGTWASGGATGLPSPESCTNLQYQVTEVSGMTMSVNFTATCAGGVTLTGSGTGTLNGSTLNWTATGTASGPGNVNCSFSLNGTAVPEGTDALKVTYTGTTCFGPISDTQILRKH